MRIAAANIPAPAAKTNSSLAVDKTSSRAQTSEARDSYQRNRSQAQVIDAEYVEFYSPSSAVFNKERQTLDSTLEPDINRVGIATPGHASSSPEVGKYQLKAHEAPPPGSYIDTFA